MPDSWKDHKVEGLKSICQWALSSTISYQLSQSSNFYSEFYLANMLDMPIWTVSLSFECQLLDFGDSGTFSLF